MIETAILLSIYHPNQRGHCSGREKAGTNCPWKGFRSSPICGDNRHASPSFLGTGDDDDHDDDGDDDGDDACGGGSDVDNIIQPPSSLLGILTDIFTLLESLILKCSDDAIW